MKNRIAILLMAALLTGMSAQASTMFMMELGVAEMVDDAGLTLSVSGNVVSVLGAQGETLEVVSLTGRPVTSVKIDGPAQRVELNLAKGCYILKVGKVVRKITIR